MAQQIATERNQVFDIEAFLTPSMREEWLAITSGRSFPEIEDRKEGVEKVKEEEKEDERADGPSTAIPETTVVEGQVKEPTPTTQTVPNNGDGATDPAPSTVPNDVTAAVDMSATTEPAAAAIEEPSVPPVPAVKQPFKLHANHPVFLNMHWKQRQKRLHQLAIREAAIERGEKPEFFPELEALIRVEEEKEKEKEREEQAGHKRKRGLTEGDVQGIRASASHW